MVNLEKEIGLLSSTVDSHDNNKLSRNQSQFYGLLF